MKNSPQTVLVIDDSLTYREEISEALRNAGYAVLTAGTGEEGLAIAFERRLAAIIVDNVLPGIDGAVVLRRLRQNVSTRRTPSLLLTASEDPREELRALEAGADSFVRKSQDLNVVLACLSAVLRSASTPAAFEAKGPRGRRRVVIADESAEYLVPVVRALQQEGYETIPAASPQELQLSVTPDVDAIILGSLPQSTPEQIAQKIKCTPSTQHARLIIAGAAEDSGAMISRLNAGADDYVLKSSGIEVLTARLRAQLRRKQLEDENREIRERMLRREVELRAQREIAEIRAARAEELQNAKELAEQHALEAQRAAAQNEAIFSSIADGIVICDPSGTGVPLLAVSGYPLNP